MLHKNGNGARTVPLPSTSCPPCSFNHSLPPFVVAAALSGYAPNQKTAPGAGRAGGTGRSLLPLRVAASDAELAIGEILRGHAPGALISETQCMPIVCTGQQAPNPSQRAPASLGWA